MSTIPTVLAPTITSFTPEKQSPSFSGQINEIVTFTILAAGNKTLTAAQLLGGFIIQTPTAAATDTLDTASNIVSQIEGAKVGSGIYFTIRNTSAGAFAITVAAGTGGTMNSGDTATIAQSNQKTFLLVVTALGDQNFVGATYTVYSMGTVVF